MLHALLRPLVLLACAAPLGAQATWIVDSQARPGSHFTDIPQAIAAASAGDTIFARPSPTPYSAFTVDKGVTMVGPLQTLSPVTIQNIPSNERFVAWGLSNGTWQDHVIQVYDCAGPVHLQRLRTNSLRWFPFEAAVGVLDIRRSQNVSLVDCLTQVMHVEQSNVLHVQGQMVARYKHPRIPLTAVGSRVALISTPVVTANICPNPRPGIQATNSDIILATSGSYVRGSTGSCATSTDITGSGGTLTYDPLFPPNRVQGTMRIVEKPLAATIVEPSWASGVYSLRSTVWAPNGSVAMTFASLPPPSYPTPIPSFAGWDEIWLDPRLLVLIHTATVPSPGLWFQSSAVMPTSSFLPPSFSNVLLSFQSVVLPPTGPMQITAPTVAMLNYTISL